MKSKIAFVVLLFVGIYMGTLLPKLWSDIGDRWAISDGVGNMLWRITSGNHLVPAANNSYDIGTSSLKVKDAYVDGVGYIDYVQCVTVATTTVVPPAIGMLARSSINTNELWISTGVGAGHWQKVGAQ